MAVCLRTLVLFVTFSACLGALRDWCPEQQEASNGFNTTQLQLALSGKKITCGAVVYPPFSIYNEETGQWSGFDIELFAEVARRGNFEYEIVKIGNPPEGETYDYILYGVGREMDMMCSWWGETAARKRRSFDFTIPTIDTSFILATPAPRPTQVPFKEQFWTFLKPFSRDLWLVLLFGVLFSSIFLYIVDPKTAAVYQEGSEEAGREEGTGVLAALRSSANAVSNLFYQGWVLCTVQDPYKNANSPWSKLYLMSWTGVIIVLLAAYTAQLTTFLIIELQSISSINNLDDLLRSGKPACAMTGISFVNTFLKNSAPSLPVVPIKNIEEAFPAIRQGRCGAALLGKSEVELMIAGNEQCDMRMVGSSLNFLAGAFAADSSNCGLFVLRVADAILQAIREEGMMEEMWEGYTEVPSGCLSASGTEEEKDQALSLEAVGGLFIIHAAVAFVAILGFSLQQYQKGKKPAQIAELKGNLESKELRVSC
uniref:Ionotropic glutamate receptor C-terminal domain-containing protein n=1 Tax=Dunaliella tertiolecta TaxID=3047 RepID=A0A7S3QNZ4_DUNTE|mmetsp:Transcript_5565/g.13088  ORF Transcript_5565/g.13088 Transcript_5565/m.13088 type:complete len:483 (+) Transcript_5565:140-1588(+)